MSSSEGGHASSSPEEEEDTQSYSVKANCIGLMKRPLISAAIAFVGLLRVDRLVGISTTVCQKKKTHTHMALN